MAIHSPLPLQTRAQLFQQLAKMESAGLPVERAFSVLDLPPNARPRLAAMRSLMKRLEFAVAGERSGVFTRLEGRLIHAAMSAGSPAATYQRLADVYTARAMQIGRVKARMVMPAAVLLLALCLDPLPGLVTGSISLGSYVLEIVRPLLFLGVIGLGLRWWLTGAASSARLRLTPLLGPLVVRQNLRDFFASLGLMLEAGIAMLDALPLALETVSDESMRADLSTIAPRVAAGAPLAQAVAEVGMLGAPDRRHQLVEFIASGEVSGRLPEMLLRHSDMESASINQWYEQLADWTPRIVYGCVMLWMASGLIGGALSRAPVI